MDCQCTDIHAPFNGCRTAEAGDYNSLSTADFASFGLRLLNAVLADFRIILRRLFQRRTRFFRVNLIDLYQ
jgi:hypothetical protein